MQRRMDVVRSNYFEWYPMLNAARRKEFSKGTLLTSVELPPNPNYRRTATYIVNEDTFNVAMQFQSTSRVAVLNMASDTCCGGGYRSGCSAQEEQLCYRSTLPLSLASLQYPWPRDGVVAYSPAVCIGRSDEASGYTLLSETPVCSVISVAAIRGPTLTRTGRYASQQDRARMWDKIDMLFRVAASRQHEHLVLGALGCGVFCNPPWEVAKLFQAAIVKYMGYFKTIVFAIYDPVPTPSSNFTVFSRVFNEWRISDPTLV